MSRWYQPADMILDPDEQAKEIVYPDVAFFIDCDYYSNEPKLDMVEDFVEKGVRTVTSITNSLANYVLGE